jgi:hypothetical protein
VRKYNPRSTKIIPRIFPKFGFDLIINICTNGRRTIFVPVIKADLEAVVYFKPSVCE